MFTPTEEQVFNNSLVAEGKNICIQAGAGSGKSTSLRYFAQQNSDKNFLILCFNKANAEESNNHPERPANIWYSTIHAIAYREIVTKTMREKLAPYLNYRDIDTRIFDKLDLLSEYSGKLTKEQEREKKDVIFALTKMVLDAVTLYTRSDSTNIKEFSIGLYSNWLGEGKQLIEENDIVTERKLVEATDEQIDALGEYTRKFWLLLIDEGSNCSITHDVYLKLFHLRGYSITTFYDKQTKQEYEIDVLGLDEAQDSNPVTVAIFKNSNIAQKIVVGDSMQQLYSWRGADDALDVFPNFETGTLTTSFRFNSTIADLANEVLGLAEAKIRVKGESTREELKSHTILCRTNSAVISTIFKYASEGLKVYTTADLQDLFSKLYHTQAVYFGTVPKFPNKSLRHIMTKEALEDAMRISPELNLLNRLAAQISKECGTLSNGINTIKQTLVDNEHDADVIVSTIHKSKGLEWDEVTIADSLIIPQPDKEQEEAVDNWLTEKDNLCILYVAITRAKVKVNIPWYLEDVLINN